MKYYFNSFETEASMLTLTELTIDQVKELVYQCDDISVGDIKEKLYYHSLPENYNEQLIKFINQHMYAEVRQFDGDGDLYIVNETPIQELRIFTLGFDEDTRFGNDYGSGIHNCSYSDYIGESAEFSRQESFDEVIQNMNDFIKMDWLNEDPIGQQEKLKFEEAQQMFIELYNKLGGHCVSWSVEYDQNWSLIYTVQPSEASFDEWYTRLIISSTY